MVTHLTLFKRGEYFILPRGFDCGENTFLRGSYLSSVVRVFVLFIFASRGCLRSAARISAEAEC